MTTEDFIKILQKEDPSGKAHIRLHGGIPMGAELKPGYWDGPYSYINEQGQYVHTMKGEKVDIWCVEPEDFVWDNEMGYCPYKDNREEAWEKLKTLFVLEYTNSIKEQRDEKERNFFKNIEDNFKEYVDYRIASSMRYTDEVVKKAKDGWKFFQKKVDKKYNWYNWKIVDENGKTEPYGTNLATSEPILLSGKFVSQDRGDYLEWILKE